MDLPITSLAIIDAPSNLGLAPLFPGHQPGTRGAPDALRALGLHAALRPQVQRRVEAAQYQPDDRRSVNIRNLHAIALHAIQLADAIEAERRAGRFVLVLGGDCSLLVGAMLANARIGHTGLIFLDGHTDFYLPEQSATGGAAGMDLALVTGWGPRALAKLGGGGPLVDPRRVSALGNRDFEPRKAADLPSIENALGCYLSLPEMRHLGLQHAMRRALAAASPNGAPYWVHLDVDVLDGAIMPSVDSPQPDGLSTTELGKLLTPALAGNAVGMQVTIYDPDKDPERTAGALLVNLLVRALGPTGQTDDQTSSS